MEGDFYGKYRLEGEIGRGASGVVYRVRRTRDGGEFAMKKIHVSSIKGGTREASSEVGMLKRLIHPHIIRFEESFADQNHLFIVMQYATKGDLHQIVKRRRVRKEYFTEPELWQMLKQLLSAIDYLHSQGIVHRDVKTLNVLVDNSNRLYLGDLGVSRILKPDGGLYSRVGTPLYLAPQIVRYERYDFKADIWGLGCISYLLATLVHPFQAKNIIMLAQNIVCITPPPVQNYSQTFNRFLIDMLQKDPNRRLSAKQLSTKYFQVQMDRFLDLQTERQIKMDDRVKEKDKKKQIQKQQETPKQSFRGKLADMRAGLAKRKIINNFIYERMVFNQEDKICEKDKSKEKKSILRQCTDASWEETIVLAKNSYLPASRKCEVTHKAKPQIIKIQISAELSRQGEQKQMGRWVEIGFGSQVGLAKATRVRPKSSIMNKERHESTMKNIKKNMRKADELGRFV